MSSAVTSAVSIRPPLDASQASTLRLDADPHDLGGPIWSLVALAAVPIMLVGLRMGQWHEIRRSLDQGPLAVATLRRSAAAREIEIAAAGVGAPVAWFAVHGEVPVGVVVIASTPDPGRAAHGIELRRRFGHAAATPHKARGQFGRRRANPRNTS
jgi:hypothetical protein